MRPSTRSKCCERMCTVETGTLRKPLHQGIGTKMSNIVEFLEFINYINKTITIIRTLKKISEKKVKELISQKKGHKNTKLAKSSRGKKGLFSIYLLKALFRLSWSASQNLRKAILNKKFSLNLFFVGKYRTRTSHLDWPKS